jgi:predicted enzyme related to lactoylglutathione lyase
MGMGVSIMLTETDSRVGQIDGAAAEGLPPRTHGTSTMADFNFVILYVDSPPASGSFYADLLGKAPVEASPTFVMFALDSGVMLGLWSRHTVEPAATPVGGGEIAVTVDDVDAVHADWSNRGLRIVLEPTDMDFGRTFVALDPDGHRLRVFRPAGP